MIMRFSRHVAGDNWIQRDEKTEFETIFQPVDAKALRQNLKQLTLGDLLTSIYMAKAKRRLIKVSTFCDYVNLVDDECVRRIDDLSPLELQQILTAFMYLFPSKITQLDFYRVAILQLAQHFSGDTRDFVTVSFFLGMWKKNDLASRVLKQFFDCHLMKHLDDLSTLDFAIVCNAAFKTSVVVPEEEFNTRLIREIEDMKDEDISLLITFVKSCRLNRVRADIVAGKIKEKIISGSLNRIDLTAVIHFFAYFADNLVKDNDVINFFLERGACYLNVSARLKDLATFLWCCAHLGVNVDQKLDLEAIAHIIREKVKRKEYKRSPDALVDTCLALWMLGQKDTGLAFAALEKFTMRKNQDRVKLDSRKILLAACLEIEANEKLIGVELFNINRPVPRYLYNRRTLLKDTFEALNNDPEVKTAKIVSPIAELNIAGILVELNSGEKVCIEVLDGSNRTSDGSPFGLLGLKVRLLEAKGFRTLVVSSYLDVKY